MKSGQSGGQGFRDVAMALPIVAALLLLPPLIRIFAAPAALGGIPLILAYIVAVWAATIVIAIIVARRAERMSDDPEDRSEASGQR